MNTQHTTTQGTPLTTALTSYNTLTTIVEEYCDGYIIISCDEFSQYEGGIWVESFADTIDKAQEKATKQHEKIIKEY
jgi:hypothetical protein